MRAFVLCVVIVGVAGLATGSPVAVAAERPPMEAATERVSDGARQIREGRVLEGTGTLATGVGQTLATGTVEAGRTVARGTGAAGRAVGRTTRAAWDATTETVIDWGESAYRLWDRLTTW